MINLCIDPYANKIMIDKHNQANKLYRFSKHQKNKLSGSTKDLNDSLDEPQTLP